MSIHEDEQCPFCEQAKHRDEQIKECLLNISKKMDWVEMDPVIREYIDIQVTKIHRMFAGSDNSHYDAREQELLNKLQD